MVRSLNNTAQKMVVTILEVDRTNKVITGVLRDQGKIQISVFDAPQAFRWPDIDELWIVQRDGVDWQLGNRIRLEQEQSIEDLAFGDLRLDANVITDKNGRTLIGIDDIPTDGRYELPGVIKMWPVATVPTGYLFCDGSENAIATYPILAALLGTTYGALTNGSGGAGTTHFRVPDFKGRGPIGVGTATDGGVTGATAHALAQKGGEETHLLTASESGEAGHNHTQNAHNHTQNAHAHDVQTYAPSAGGHVLVAGAANNADAGGAVPSAGIATTATNIAATATNIAVATASAAAAHQNMSPYLSLNFIIKT